MESTTNIQCVSSFLLSFGGAKYAYLCGARIHAGTMSLIHYLTPRCSLLLTPRSVCPNGKNTCHSLGDGGRQTGGHPQ